MLRLPYHKSSYLKLEPRILPAFWKFPEVNVFHRIFAAVSSRKKPPQSQNSHDDGVEGGGREESRARGGKAVGLHREVSARA